MFNFIRSFAPAIGGRWFGGNKLVVLLVCILNFAGIAPIEAEARKTIAEALQVAPFTDSDRQKVAAGEMVVTGVLEISGRELAVAAACLIPANSKDVLHPFRVRQPFLPKEYLRDFAEIKDPPDERAFGPFTLGPDATKEAMRYLKVKPGYDLNLSAEEISTFNAIQESKKPAEVVQRVDQALLGMLFTRYQTYRAKGLAGIPPYVRGSGKMTRPHEELTRSLGIAQALKVFFPAFHKTLVEYPKGLPPGTEETFFWSRVEIDGRPALILSHRLSMSIDNSQIIGERNFYTSHFFNVAQTVAAQYSVQKGSLFAYVHRVWVDRWNGFAAIKREAGREMIRRQIENLVVEAGICGA